MSSRPFRTRRSCACACIAIAILMAWQSIAWACGSATPTISVAPTSGLPGTVIEAVATGVTLRAVYELRFADSAALSGKEKDQCGVAAVIGGPTTADARGNALATGIIPANAASGMAEVWFANTVTTTNRSPSAIYTVVGGEEDCSPYLYRRGANSATNFTPRPVNDTAGWPNNGLSTFSDKTRACIEDVRKVQVLDRDVLASVTDLVTQPDKTLPGHYFLQGNTEALHLEWAASRDGANDNNQHRLTAGARNSILREELCP